MASEKALEIPSMDFDPENYAALWQTKQEDILKIVQQFEPAQIASFASPPQNYRMRAEFRIWHDKNARDGSSTCHYVMFDRPNPRTPVKLTRFPVAHASIDQLMGPLLTEINANDTLRQKLFQIEFLATSINDMLVTLIYHRPLEEDWALAARASGSKFGIKLIGRSRKQKLVLQDDFVEEAFTVGDRRYASFQGENAFTQPNHVINSAMMQWLDQSVTQLDTSQSALLEMYCGNGNFTLPLSRHFRKVLATEISKRSIELAKKTAQ